MVKEIFDIAVSTNKKEEKELEHKGYTKIPVNLNPENKPDGTYLWYSHKMKHTDSKPITRIQFSFTEGMEKGLIAQNYQKVFIGSCGGPRPCIVYVWYFQGTTKYDIPIEDLWISPDLKADAEKFKLPCWERSAFNLNMAGGTPYHLWMKRSKQPYICDVTATDNFDFDAELFGQGYIRIDENTNRGSGVTPVFIWYRETIENEDFIKDLQIFTNQEEVNNLGKQYYQLVRINLDKGGANVFLWFKKESGKEAISLVTLVGLAEVPLVKPNATVIQKNVNEENKCFSVFLCFK
ncbi:PREDICTED: uncharacterized protein LOC107105138 [Cyprinodon variegatus]|uniref:uncharacterized protein LOC107105138 n=1 Tax=Cyprinodon variegatus TaxID=28743 RepID=UPI000742A7B1|nr:PREDICTED: uncharacterized protein LOC107105138 [Cyprinodon variegatus]